MKGVRERRYGGRDRVSREGESKRSGEGEGEVCTCTCVILK